MRPSLDFYCVAQNGNGNPIPIRFHHESTKNHFRAFCPQLSKLKNCPTSPSHHFRVGVARSDVPRSARWRRIRWYFWVARLDVASPHRWHILKGKGMEGWKCHQGRRKKLNIWVWVNTYRYIFSGMNIHLPAILGFTRYQGFDPSPYFDIFGGFMIRNAMHQDHQAWTKMWNNVKKTSKVGIGRIGWA